MYNEKIRDLRQDEKFLKQDQYDLADLAGLIAFLASDDGCPWDRVQTAQTLQRNLLEEAYEAFDAIDGGDDKQLREELGDLLLQVVFQANLAGTFDLGDVVNTVTKKMIDRHTHVFGQDKADPEATDQAEAVLDIWEQNKRKEKKQNSHSEAIRQIARALPALTRADKIQSKAAEAGFDWPTIDGASEKIHEEILEAEQARSKWQEALARGADAEQARQELEMESGDLLFAVVNWVRHAGIDPEIALGRSNQKFMDRFSAVEAAVQADGLDMTEMHLTDLDRYWEQIKSEGL